MQKTSAILGLACQVMTFGILLVKLIDAVIILLGGVTNYNAA